MQKKNFARLLLPLLFLQTSCATLKDSPICKEITPDRGTCVHILSGKQYEVNEINKLDGKTWWEMRPLFIQVPSQTWADIKAFIIKTCKKYKNCGEEVPSWDRTIQTVDDMAGE